MMDVFGATARLTREVPEAEANIQNAMVSMAGLLHTMTVAMRDTQTGGAEAMRAVTHAISALQGLSNANTEMARAHGRLLSVYRETAAGDVDECPPPFGLLEASQAA